MSVSFLSQAGGVKYHLRAALNRKRWRPFCQFVDSWLQDWLSDSKIQNRQTLVLIGPSAGYSLPVWLSSRFINIVAVEPDPLAFALLQLKLQKPLKWVRDDYFGLANRSPDPTRLKKLFADHPDAVFLFCNVLGQLPVLLREKKGCDVEKYMQNLAEVLAELSKSHMIASYHDRYSYHRRRPNEVIDHLTEVVSSRFKHKKEFPWEISKNIVHQIEFVRTE